MVTCVYFRIRWRSNFVSSFYPNNKPIWRHCSNNIALFMGHVLNRFYCPGYRRIRFEYAMCGRGNFWIRKEKVADSKISGYEWTGPNIRKLFSGWSNQPGEIVLDVANLFGDRPQQNPCKVAKALRESSRQSNISLIALQNREKQRKNVGVTS